MSGRPGPVRAGIYVRISQDREGAGLGVARQEADCRALCERRGWQVVDVYPDNDVSATSSKPRKQWQRLLADIDAGLVTAVVCWHVDRLTRSPRELEDVIDLADRLGVELATVTGEIDLSSVTGRLVARMLGAAARHETEHKSERQRRKARQVAEAGTPQGGDIRPYGYAKDRVTIVDSEAAVIRDLTRRILAGESLASVTRDLQDGGIPTVTGRPWRTQTVRRILGSARISGRREYIPTNSFTGARPLVGEITHELAWPAIISVEDSDRLRALLSRPERRTNRGAVRSYVLSGILRCAICGAGMVGRVHYGKRRYNCVGKPGSQNCGRLAIHADHTDAHVRDLVLTALDSPELLARLHRSGDSSLDAEQLTAKLRAIEERRDQLAADWATGEITRREWQTARSALEAQTEQLHAKLAHTQDGHAIVQLARLNGDLWTRWETMNLSQRHALVKAVIDRVIVHPRVLPGPWNPDRLEPIWKA